MDKEFEYYLLSALKVVSAKFHGNPGEAARLFIHIRDPNCIPLLKPYSICSCLFPESSNLYLTTEPFPQNLYTENYKMLVKEIKEGLNKWKKILYGLIDSLLLRYLFFPNLSIIPTSIMEE